MKRTVYPLLDGWVEIAWEENCLCAIRWLPDGAPQRKGTGGAFPDLAYARLLECMSGDRETLDLPCAGAGTPFQRRVWQALSRIPRGEVRTYAEVAAEAGVPGGARAVGNALNRNPFQIAVPCHRVVRGDGSLGGYAGGPRRKRQLLALEGAFVPIP